MIHTTETLKVGDRVYYTNGSKIENGIIKEIPEFTKTSVRVVYNCGGDWDNYMNYTSALTNLNDLSFGWNCEQ